MSSDFSAERNKLQKIRRVYETPPLSNWTFVLDLYSNFQVNLLDQCNNHYSDVALLEESQGRLNV